MRSPSAPPSSSSDSLASPVASAPPGGAALPSTHSLLTAASVSTSRFCFDSCPACWRSKALSSSRPSRPADLFMVVPLPFSSFSRCETRLQAGTQDTGTQGHREGHRDTSSPVASYTDNGLACRLASRLRSVWAPPSKVFGPTAIGTYIIHGHATHGHGAHGHQAVFGSSASVLFATAARRRDG